MPTAKTMRTIAAVQFAGAATFLFVAFASRNWVYLSVAPAFIVVGVAFLAKSRAVE